jgi:adenylosuccinate synthase
MKCDGILALVLATAIHSTEQQTSTLCAACRYFEKWAQAMGEVGNAIKRRVVSATRRICRSFRSAKTVENEGASSNQLSIFSGQWSVKTYFVKGGA